MRTYDSRQSCLLWSAEQGDQIKNVRVAEATTAAVDEKGRAWQLLSIRITIFSIFDLRLLLFLASLTARRPDDRALQASIVSLLISSIVVCIPLDEPIDFCGYFS